MAPTHKEASLESPLAIVGDEDIVSGFKALGFRVFPIGEMQEMKTIVSGLISAKCAVCLVQDNFYSRAKEGMEGLKNAAGPALIPFGKDGNLPLLDVLIKEMRRKATGRA